MIEYCNDALEVDHKMAKALFLKGRALSEQTEYAKAIEVLTDMVEFNPDNEDGKKELGRVQGLLKAYEDKTKKMA